MAAEAIGSKESEGVALISDNVTCHCESSVCDGGRGGGGVEYTHTRKAKPTSNSTHPRLAGLETLLGIPLRSKLLQ